MTGRLWRGIFLECQTNDVCHTQRHLWNTTDAFD